MILGSKRIFIIAAGPSAKGLSFDKLKGKGYILGVNDAGLRAPCDGVFTMDRLWWENRWKDVKYSGLEAFVRHCVYDRWEGKKGTGWYRCHRIEMDYQKHFLSDDKYYLNGRNSGFGAFNLAYLVEPLEIYLFGFDMQDNGKQMRWYKNYEWCKASNGNRYRKWAEDFDKARSKCDEKRIRVYNCSNNSRIKKFPVLSWDEVLKSVEIVL